jgi:hypothetical protein
MSNHKKPNQPSVVPSNAVAEIDAMSQSLGYAAALSRAELINLRSRGKQMPIEVIELLADHAEQNGGSVVGVPFDAAAARDALARSKAARAVAKAAYRLARRAESDSVQSLALVADRSRKITQAMSVDVRTPEGEAFAAMNDQVRAMLRAAGHPRKSRKAKVTANATPNDVAKPKPAPTSTPS